MKIGSSPPQDGRSPGKSQQLNQKQSAGTAGATHGAMHSGDVVKGRVLSIDPQGLVTIETANGRFFAKSLTALSVGDQILLEIVKAGDTPLVNVATGRGKVLDILRVLMPWLKPGQVNSQGMLEAFQGETKEVGSEGQFAKFLEKNSVGATPDPLQQMKIGALISSMRSGAGVPETLQNILGLLGTGSLEEVSHPELKKMAQLFEAHAALSSKDGQVTPHSAPSQSFDYLLFPCFFANGAGTGEWMFSFEQSEAGEKEKEYSVAFYLTMSRLGDVHLQLSLAKSKVVGVFTLESDAAVQHMQKQIHELQEILKPLFGNAVFTCQAAPEKSIEKLKSDLQQKSGLVKFALLDVSV